MKYLFVILISVLMLTGCEKEESMDSKRLDRLHTRFSKLENSLNSVQTYAYHAREVYNNWQKCHKEKRKSEKRIVLDYVQKEKIKLSAEQWKHLKGDNQNAQKKKLQQRSKRIDN